MEEEIEEYSHSALHTNKRNLDTYLNTLSLKYGKTQQDINREDVNIINIGPRYKKSYAAPEEKVIELFDMAEKCRIEAVPNYLLEKQTFGKTGIMIDLDFKLSNSNAVSLDNDSLREIVKCTMKKISSIILVSGESTKNYVFIITKPKSIMAKIKEETYYKYGIHVLVPSIQISKGCKKYLIEELSKDSSFNETAINIIGSDNLKNTDDVILDKNSATVPVCLYGSCKSNADLTFEPYFLHSVFEIIEKVKKIEIKDVTKIFTGIKSHSKFYDISPVNLIREMSLLYDGDIVKKKKYNPKGGLDIEKYEKEKELVVAKSSDFKPSTFEEREIKECKDLLDILDSSYFTEYSKFRNVIFALSSKGDKYYPLAEYFASKCSDEKGYLAAAKTFNDMWNSGINRNPSPSEPKITIGSLYKWAEVSNREKYISIKKDSAFMVLMKKCFDYGGIIGHSSVAEIMHIYYRGRYVVGILPSSLHSRGSYTWSFLVSDGDACKIGERYKWRVECYPDEFDSFLSTDLPKLFEQCISFLSARMEKEDESSVAKETDKKTSNIIKQMVKSKCKLQDNAFKKGVISQAEIKFHIRGFYDMLDKDGNIFGCANGVLNLGTECILVSGMHDYYISKFTPIMYKPFNPDDEPTKIILTAIKNTIPELDARLWLMFFLSTGLYGNFKQSYLLMWIGGGNNGKSFILTLWKNTLGDQYCTKIPVDIFTGKRESAEKPNSAFMRFKGRRAAFAEESNVEDIINTARLKELINTRETSARELNQKQEKIDMTSTLVLASNHRLKLDNISDYGSTRRIKFYESKIKFVKDPASSFERKEDKAFMNSHVDDEKYKIAFLSILVHFYQRLKKEYSSVSITSVKSKTINNETNKYFQSQDPLYDFISKTIIKSKSIKQALTIDEIAVSFQEWQAKIYDGYKSHRSNVKGIIKLLENSILGKFITTNEDGKQVLERCKIELDYIHYCLEPGEKYLIVEEKKTNKIFDDEQYDWWNYTLNHETGEVNYDSDDSSVE